MLSPLPRQVRETQSLVTNPSTSAFPKFRVGRLLHYGFRGLFSVHSRYGLQTRQVALCDPLHRRLRRLCCLHRRSNCYRVERSSSRAGLSFPLWTSAFSRRTDKSPLHSSSNQTDVNRIIPSLVTGCGVRPALSSRPKRPQRRAQGSGGWSLISSSATRTAFSGSP
jgi:hypothetical protein